ncbi:hypothetical protein ACJ6WD_38315 [Streptomyces sp. VTCC 41912]
MLKFPESDRILATALRLRKVGIRELLAQLFSVVTSAPSRAVHEF